MGPLGLLSFLLFALLLYLWVQTSHTVWGTHPLKPPGEGSFLNDLRGEEPERREGRMESLEGGIAQWIQYLNVIATVAPMVGLLGTVSGMIGAFQTIAGGGMGKPEKLAGDIGEALITTATGLCIGIPAMIGFFALRNRLDNRARRLWDLVEEAAEQGQINRPVPPTGEPVREAGSPETATSPGQPSHP